MTTLKYYLATGAALLLCAASIADASSRRAPELRSTPTAGETVVVTTLNDTTDFAAPQTVAELPGPDGKISFREAVTATNNTPGPQRIEFAIPQNEWWLVPGVALLRLEVDAFFITDDETTVDFASQTAFTGDTNPNGNEVGIYGIQPNAWGVAAIFVMGDNCVIRGLDQVHQRGYGVEIRGNNNRVIGSTISGPWYAGVYISGGFQGLPATGNIIGGTAPGEGNSLSGGNSGVRIDGPAADNLVIGNTLLTGSSWGVEVRGAPAYGMLATNNRIGGPTAAERNVIAGAGRYGEEGFPVGGQVSILNGEGTIVQGNYIGTNAAGTASFGQRGPAGISLRDSSDTQIVDNLISGIIVVGVNHYVGQRFGNGIVLSGSTAGTVIRGNLIGTDVTGQNAIPNRAGLTSGSFPGSPSPSGVTIGGSGEGEGNRIAFSETHGVAINSTAQGIRISGNSIEANGTLGIDLYGQAGAGVTLNDAGDGDEGGNGLQNFPVLQSALVDAGGSTISGSLNSLPNTEFRLEFFSSAQCDPSGHGEGAIFLGAHTVTTDASGNATFTAVVAPAAVGSSITATATQSATGNTSEFSACQIAAQSSASTFALVSAVSRKAHGPTGEHDIALTLKDAPTVESRSSGGTQTLVFTFTSNVTSGSASLSNGSGNVVSTVLADNTMTVNLDGVADAQTLTVLLSGVTDEFARTLSDTAVSMRVLVGDTTGNGVVNASDIALTKAYAGQALAGEACRADVNASGGVNATDVGMVKASVGLTVN